MYKRQLLQLGIGTLLSNALEPVAGALNSVIRLMLEADGTGLSLFGNVLVWTAIGTAMTYTLFKLGGAIVALIVKLAALDIKLKLTAVQARLTNLALAAGPLGLILGGLAIAGVAAVGAGYLANRSRQPSRPNLPSELQPAPPRGDFTDSEGLNRSGGLNRNPVIVNNNYIQGSIYSRDELLRELNEASDSGELRVGGNG